MLERDLAQFVPRLRLSLAIRDYVIKTAESAREVEQALRLRHEVFYRERLGYSRPDGLDVDRFDPICDHILAVQMATGQVVGTYRLNPSPDHDCYSRQEFDISSILRLEGKKLEIGRGCVRQSGRTRGVFMTLWAGIAEYMSRSGTRYAFGCLSMPASEDLGRVRALYGFLQTKHHSTGDCRVYPLNPLPGCPTAKRSPAGDEVMDEATSRRLLPLLSVYLHAGAVVCGEPAYDESFRTYDFFTLLDLQGVTSAGNRLFRTPDRGSFRTVRSFMKE